MKILPVFRVGLRNGPSFEPRRHPGVNTTVNKTLFCRNEQPLLPCTEMSFVSSLPRPVQGRVCLAPLRAGRHGRVSASAAPASHRKALHIRR